MIRNALLFAAFLTALAGCATTARNAGLTPEQHDANAQNLVLKKNYTEAALELEQALQKNPDATRLYLQRADLLEITGRTREARRTYQSTLEILGADALHYSEVLWRLALLQADAFGEAAATRRLAAELPEESFRSHDAFGMAALAEGDPAAALEHLKQALALAEDNDSKGWALYHAALAYRKKGDMKNASASLYHAINLGENLALVSKIEKLWEQIQSSDH